MLNSSSFLTISSPPDCYLNEVMFFSFVEHLIPYVCNTEHSEYSIDCCATHKPTDSRVTSKQSLRLIGIVNFACQLGCINKHQALVRPIFRCVAEN